MCKFITATGNGIESARHLCTSVAAKWLFARSLQLIACGMRCVAAGAYVVFVRGAANEKCINVCMYALNCRGRCCWLPDGKRSGTNAHMLKQS